MNSTYIIAEAGVNHDGDVGKALRLVQIAADSGADAVKFQTFVASELASPRAKKAAYQVQAVPDADSQLAMLSGLELSPDDHRVVAEACHAAGIEFLSTPFGIESLKLILHLGVERVKIASGEITNGPLLLAAARTELPLIISTGMSTVDDVDRALQVVAHGITNAGDPGPGLFRSNLDTTALVGRVTLLHCTSEYPAPYDHVHLRAMDTLADRFGLPVGYSDHTVGLTVPVAAVARGATVIEKHFTIDRADPGPDHAASLEPDELADMVKMIRQVEAALGNAEKAPTLAEIETRTLVRRSVVARRPLAKGKPFTSMDLSSTRPGDGLSPMQTWELIGTPATRDYQIGEAIDPIEDGA